MLHLADICLTFLHLVIIGFNLLGWIWKATRKWHLYSALLTAASWLILGIWHGLGYCPVTDWQWQVKEKLGEQNLPNSFIKYLADKFSGTDVSTTLIDSVTAISFGLVLIISLWLNFRRRNNKLITT